MFWASEALPKDWNSTCNLVSKKRSLGRPSQRSSHGYGRRGDTDLNGEHDRVLSMRSSLVGPRCQLRRLDSFSPIFLTQSLSSFAFFHLLSPIHSLPWSEESLGQRGAISAYLLKQLDLNNN